jgi:hypothetical protein
LIKQLATAVVLALAGVGLGVPAPAHAAPIPLDCCETEFDWAAPYAEALQNHGLQYLITDMGITSALAMENGCGLVPAIGAAATVNKIAKDYGISSGSAGKLLVAAADVCPEIRSRLG